MFVHTLHWQGPIVLVPAQTDPAWGFPWLLLATLRAGRKGVTATVSQIASAGAAAEL